MLFRPKVIDSETTARIVQPDGGYIELQLILRYDPSDPYAVQALFYGEFNGNRVVPWVFARELLFNGLREGTGIGNVRVWPLNTPRRESVALSLTSLAGAHVLLEIPHGFLTCFLLRTFKQVPMGEESLHLCIEDTFTGPSVRNPYHSYNGGRPPHHRTSEFGEDLVDGD